MSEIFLEQWKPSLQYTGQEDVTGQKPGQHTFHLTFLYHSGFLLPKDQCISLNRTHKDHEPTDHTGHTFDQMEKTKDP